MAQVESVSPTRDLHPEADNETLECSEDESQGYSEKHSEGSIPIDFASPPRTPPDNWQPIRFIYSSTPESTIEKDAKDLPKSQMVQTEVNKISDAGATTPRDTNWPDVDIIRYQGRRASSAAGVASNRPLAEIDWKSWSPGPKRPHTEFVIERMLRDQLESVKEAEGCTRKSYRLQKEEVDLLADLLNNMLKNYLKGWIGPAIKPREVVTKVRLAAASSGEETGARLLSEHEVNLPCFRR
ncbi:hypothetical protein DL770_010378 [Monosporascus sp. CRB-9-2]|nr:hypothetical protein DL770_010378 [Monosporascus sp. CRB-9-2]